LAPDLGEGVEIFGYWKTELTADGIRVAINEVLEDDSYTINATRLGEELIELGGVSRAVDLIQEMM
jgi:UDP:flavonoid glycosyltransferase YjiC (YdhE family)